jgi:hypothetical protein
VPCALPTNVATMSVFGSCLRMSASTTLLTERSLLRRCSDPVLSDEKYHALGCLFLSRIVSGMSTGGHLWYMHRVCRRLFLVQRYS